MSKLATLLAVLALAACPLQKSGSTTTLGAGNGNGNSGGGGGGGDSGEAGMITMPDLTGKTEDQARSIVKSAGFTNDMEVRPLSCDAPTQADDTIECQEPDAGKSVRSNSWVRVGVHYSSRMKGIVHRDEFEAMKGMTIDQAKAFAKKIGHTGEIKVEALDRFYEGCQEGKVCIASDRGGGQSGMSLGDPLHLGINPKLDIAPPPD